MRMLITGGAGFVGSHLACSFKRDNPQTVVVAFDNLKRRGSELNLALLRERGVEFVHGDIRNSSDLDDLTGSFDILVEASAEPSVLAGLESSPHYLLHTNLRGTLNCLEFARRRAGSFVFLSSSRVYSIAPLKSLNLRETATRFELEDEQVYCGASRAGIAESFPTNLPRSLYGASKLASELIIQEYADTYGLCAVIDRCGVIAGAGQFGKVDQGVFTLWVANHYFGKPLKYTGFGGCGKQVRDLLHPSDVFALIKKQLANLDDCSGAVFNVGGGRSGSVSLCELTAMCREVVGREVPIEQDAGTSPVDIPLYISDSTSAACRFDWRPECSPKNIVRDIFHWLKAHETQLRPIFA